MKYLWECRRTFLALVGILCLTGLSMYLKTDMSGSIAMIIMGIAGANAAQGAFEKKFDSSKSNVDDPDKSK